MQVRFLGTGSPTPRLERAGTAIVALFDDAGVLLDCGPGTTLRLVQAGVALSRVTHLLFTHLHFDHCTDFPFFALSRWDQAAGSAAALQVIGPPGVEQFSRRLFGPEGAFAPDIAARRFHPMSQAVWTERGGRLPRPAPELSVQEAPVGHVVRGRSWTIRAGLASHAQPQLECYGYRVEADDRTIVFTGDTGYCASIVELARGADVLIHMCAFLDEEMSALGIPGMEEVCGSPSVAARVAAEAGAGELVLTHFQSPRLQTPEGQAAAIVAAKRIFGGPVRTASDLLVL
jgi:ribonuclease BN (tRNA processing enzyme)